MKVRVGFKVAQVRVKMKVRVELTISNPNSL